MKYSKRRIEFCCDEIVDLITKNFHIFKKDGLSVLENGGIYWYELCPYCGQKIEMVE